jgi:hypothetical protein
MNMAYFIKYIYIASRNRKIGETLEELDESRQQVETSLQEL